MKQLLKTTSKFSIVILVFALWGCTEVESLLPSVSSNFTYTNAEGTGLVKFINTSEDATKYEWNFGDGTTSTQINPVKTYTASDTYTVTLKAINPSGSSDVTSSEIEIEIDQPEPLECTEETEQSLDASDFNLTFQTDPGDDLISDGAAYTYINNPDTNNNPSCFVGQIVRNPDFQFANNQIEFDAKFDFNANTGFKLLVWAPAVGTPVLLKLEDKTNASTFVEVSAETTTANAWEELTFDFAPGDSDKYDKIVLFFDIGTGSSSTYYIDDFRLYGENTGGGNSLEDCGGDLVNDFESADDTIFSNFGGGVGTIIDNPDTSVNTSAKLGQYVKGAGEVFAGITIAVDPDIDFNAGVFSIDVNSQAVRQLLFKLEGPGIEVILPTSGTGWETLTYDFSAVAGNVGTVTDITLIMDNGTAGDGSGDWTIQFDNIRLCSNGSGAGTCPPPPTGELLSNGGFEANSGDGACWQLNQGGGTITIIDTDANSGTYSVRLTTGPANVPNIKQERFAPSIAGSQGVQVTFRYKVTQAFVDGSILQVLAFSEFTTAGAEANDLGNADVSTVDVWQTYTGTFTTAAGIEEGISLLIQATCGGAATCAGEVIIDDVVVTEI
ncbi:PKD domain-containing protein [Flavobacteriaceae bacterium D16]|nr:PKD domain-containing protein [Flavobacteriaceae bacterium D16]